jgi:hypothetical protein
MPVNEHRVTFNLTDRAVVALDRVRAVLGVSKTSAINRALVLSAYIVDAAELYVRREPDGELERIQIL